MQMLEQMFGKERVACCHSIKGRRSRPAEGGRGEGSLFAGELRIFGGGKDLIRRSKTRRRRRRRSGSKKGKEELEMRKGGKEEEKRGREIVKKSFSFSREKGVSAPLKRKIPQYVAGEKNYLRLADVWQKVWRRFSDVPQYIFYPGIWEITRAVFLEFSGGAPLTFRLGFARVAIPGKPSGEKTRMRSGMNGEAGLP